MRLRNDCRLYVLALFAASATLNANAAETTQVSRSDGASTPLTVYVPAGKSCAGIALISPGAGGSEKGLSWLAEDLSQRGFLAVVMGHKESGLEVLRDDMRAQGGLRSGLHSLTTDSAAYKARFLDIGAALDWARPHCAASYKVLLGHSMGAATVMLEAGASNQLGLEGQDRFDAYVALSPQGPGAIFPEHAWSRLHKPLLSLTGTHDQALEGDWHSRTLPFQDLPGGCQWLGVIDGASHMNFAGSGFSGSTERLGKLVINAFLAEAPSGHCPLPLTPKSITLDSK